MAFINDKPNRLAIDAMAPGPNDRVLELGFGPGWALRTVAARAPAGQFFGIDQSDRMLGQAANINQAAIAAGRMQLVKGQFHPLPWIDRTFNKILLVNVAYFFDADGNDAAEVFRVLKPGGRLVVYVTARETMEKWPFAGPDTHRTYDSNDLRNLLENSGFRRADIRIQTLTLPFGIRGLLATAEKSNARLSVTAEGHPMTVRNTEKSCNWTAETFRLCRSIKIWTVHDLLDAGGCYESDKRIRLGDVTGSGCAGGALRDPDSASLVKEAFRTSGFHEPSQYRRILSRSLNISSTFCHRAEANNGRWVCHRYQRRGSDLSNELASQ
jgi:ubiquinone/menaquinone biosynthesis C-methylase UbiE